MISSSFVASKAKLKNAFRHIALTVELVAHYQRDNPMLWTNVAQPGSGEKAIRFDLSASLPEEIVLSAGDAIHNLRACLDIAAVDAVRISGGSTKNVYFPFADKKENLDQAIKNKNFHRAFEPFQDVVKTAEPFTGGNKLLRGLHDLDIMDKHIVLIATSYLAKIPYLKMGSSTLVDFTVGKSRRCDLSYPESVTPITIGQVYPSVLISNYGPLTNYPLTETLQDMSEVTAGILGALTNVVGE